MEFDGEKSGKGTGMVQGAAQRGEGGERPWKVDRLSVVPSYVDFLHKYLITNRPCILPRALIEDWPAWKEWRCGTTSCASSSSTSSNKDVAKEDADANMDLRLHRSFLLLASRYGEHVVPVVVRRGEEEEERREMKLKDAVEEMRCARARGRSVAKGAEGGSEETLIYIKDWHLVRLSRLAGQEAPYVTPDLFRDDWMNNDSPLTPNPDVTASSSSTLPDDFRFCYAGLSGTFTPLHRDVYTSYSWSTNIVGRKRWTLYSPQLAPLLRRADGRGAPLSEGERLELEERKSGCRGERVEVVQEEGETIFVPSNCYHEVFNLSDCISLNHNWCNSVNLPRMYDAMKEEMGEVRYALRDVEEMLRTAGQGERGSPWQVEFWGLVAEVSRADAGWDWAQFWGMVRDWTDRPGCEAELQPDWGSFVQLRLRAMCEDFKRQEEWLWLEEGVRGCVAEVERRCTEGDEE
ncbi:Clavaminate synthase-like protein [Jaminaea rosea]|uniref:Clavaminate synthase-like protein n=1 Tax=Jaminaea rosea TaxID=1569628 RepID=A0A316UGN9_9BASI|nr:Clavaminate synthase-like protein [Jaminaea rosea]PWN24360.1 Clavaminate synthase-like protein [Jaminaea rosea]